jgi:hypothetical protein
MNAVTATTLRRAALWSAALAATLIGHVVATGGLRILPVAPALWIGAVAVTVPLGAVTPARVTFRAWGPARVLVVLLAAQAALHLAMHHAPALFGLGAHAHGPLASPAVLAVHAGLAVASTLLVCAGQRMLLRALAVVRALLPPGPRRPLPRAPRLLIATVAAPRRAEARAPRTSRGPPAVLTRLAPGSAPQA